MLSEKPWKIEPTLRLVLALFVCYSVGMLLLLLIGAQHSRGGVAPKISTLQMVIATLSFQGAALVLVARFLKEQRLGWAEAFGFNVQANRAILLGLVVAFAMVPFSWILQWICKEALTPFPFSADEQSAVQLLRGAHALADRIYLGFATILLAPVAEELLFRGVLYPVIKQLGFPRLALWGTSIFFAAVHQSPVLFIPLTFLAMVLALLYERTGNLLAPMVVHSVFNTVNFVVFYLQQEQLSAIGCRL